MIDKYNILIRKLKQLKQVAIAFSGGVDSTFLLSAAKEALGENVIALSVITPYIPASEIDEAEKLAKSIGVDLVTLKMDIPDEIRDNPDDRCYICKKKIFELMQQEVKKRGFENILDGTNIDDFDDIRPGIKALQELAVVSPLAEIGFSKKEIRQLSKEKQLPTWDKPAYACLLSRIPYNTSIEEETLRKVEKAESLIRDAGFREVRVRSHGELARIELKKENIMTFIKQTENLIHKIKKMGYKFVTIDLEGYKMGSLNKH